MLDAPCYPVYENDRQQMLGLCCMLVNRTAWNYSTIGRSAGSVMTDEIIPTSLLPATHRDALLELGARGAGGNFDPVVMSTLLTLGFVEVRSNDRRLVLTETGRAAFQELQKRDGRAEGRSQVG